MKIVNNLDLYKNIDATKRNSIKMKKNKIIEPLDEYKKYIIVTLSLTSNCNFRCSYCYQSHDDIKTLNLNNCIKFIKSVQSKYPEKEVVITLMGGEITIIPNIKEFIKKLYSLNTKISITTNGSKPKEWWDDIAEYIYQLTISYHYKSHNKIVFLEMCEYLSKILKYHITISLMIEPKNFKEIYNFGKKLGNISNVVVSVKKIRETNKRIKKYESFEYLKFTDEQMVQLNKKNKFFTKITKPFDKVNPMGASYVMIDGVKTSVNKIIMNEENKYKGWTCFIGLGEFYVNFNGDIYGATCSLGDSLGHIDKTWKFPSEPIICTKDFCFCRYDLYLTKIKN